MRCKKIASYTKWNIGLNEFQLFVADWERCRKRLKMASKKYYKKNACCVVHSRLLRVFAHLRSLQASTWNEKKNGKQLMQNSKMIMRISSTENRFVWYFCAWSSQGFFCSIFNWHFFESSENNEHFPCVSCEFRRKSFSIFPRDISPSDKQTFCIGNKQKKTKVTQNCAKWLEI